MATPPPSPTPISGGFVLAAAILIGTVIGVVAGQPSAGFVGGAVVGGVALAAIWWIDKRRGR